MNRLVPPGANDLSQYLRVVLMALVDLADRDYRMFPHSVLLVSMTAVISTVFQGCMDHVPSAFGVSVLW